uniref:tetratricopeptide repeat protein n=1 Tax=Chamaesiphon sp. VAR_48_metabat_403 TaxID=2964700 RepID=UPI00286E5F03
PQRKPNQYPPIRHWVGRDELLTELHNHLQQGYQVMVLRGQGGIGKTSLAVKLMAACGIDPLTSTPIANCSYDNALFFKVENGKGFDAISSAFLAAFGLGADRASTPAQTIDLILARLQEERWLIVIDNLESVMEIDRRRAESTDVGELLNRFANVAHKSQIVITSRTFPDDLNYRRGRSLNPSVVDRLIPGISKEASIQLLNDLGARENQDDLEWIAEKVNNVLILGWLAAYSRNQPGRLRNKPKIVTNEAEPIVREQWELQGAPAQDLLQRMCVLRIAMDVPALTRLRLLQADDKAMEFTPESEEVTEELLIGLGKSDLVQCLYDESLFENRYVLHPLMAETLQAIFAEDRQQLCDFAARLYGSFDRPAEYRSLEDLQFLLEEAHFHWESRSIENSERLVSIVINDLLPKLKMWCYWDLEELWLTRLLAIAIKVDNKRLIATYLVSLGYTARNRSDYDKAEDLYNKALDVWTQLDNRAEIAATWILLGDIARYRRDRDYDKAEDLYNKALDVYTQLDDRGGMATSWCVLGLISHKRDRDYDKAEDLYNKALDVWTRLDNREGMANSLISLGENEFMRGDLSAAEIWLKKALSATEDLQMTWDIAMIDWRLAQLYRARDNEEKAQHYYAISHALYTKLRAKGHLEIIEQEWL